MPSFDDLEAILNASGLAAAPKPDEVESTSAATVGMYVITF